MCMYIRIWVCLGPHDGNNSCEVKSFVIVNTRNYVNICIKLFAFQSSCYVNTYIHISITCLLKVTTSLVFISGLVRFISIPHSSSVSHAEQSVLVLLYTAGIHHPSMISIQSIMHHCDTTVSDDPMFPGSEGMYIRTT